MIARRIRFGRSAAVVLLAAITVSVLHQHAPFDADKRASCPAAAWHAGAVMHDATAITIAVATLVLPAPPPRIVAYVGEGALRPWSSRAPPRDA